MNRILSLIVLALLMQGCAAHVTSLRQSPDGDVMRVDYNGPAGGAVAVMNADTTGYNAETARVAVEQGMPISMQTSEHGTSLSAGYTGYGMYGGYGGGYYGYGQVAPDVITVGPGPGGAIPVQAGPDLPVLGQQGYTVSPASASEAIDPSATCPENPVTLSEIAACVREERARNDWQTEAIGKIANP